MVRELAVEAPGVELLIGETATAMLGANGRPTGVRIVNRERRQREISARVVVAADGRDSRIAELAGDKARVMRHRRFGYFAYYRNLPLVSGNSSMLWLLDPDVAAALPQDDGIVLMTTFQTRDRESWFKRDLEANFEAYFRGLPGAPDLAAGERTSKILGKMMKSDYSTGRRLNPIERMLFSAAAKDDRVADMFAAFGGRSVRPNDREFARLVGRAIKVNARREDGAPLQPLSGAHADGTPLPARVVSTRPTINGLVTPVSSVGDPDSAEAVVFVHGNPGSRRDWDDLLTRVAPFARAVALDMPGFGRAERPRHFSYIVDGYARFLGSALDHLGVQRAHLVLHDFGGPWGLEWAIANPERFASAVLINTGALVDYRWHHLAKIWRTPVAGEAFQATTTRSGLRMALRHGNPRGLPRAFVDRMYDDIDRGTTRAVLSLYRATNDPGCVGRRHADALGSLDRPALVVWGAHDPYIPVAIAQRQREAFPRAELAILEDSGHWPFADDPDGVGRHVEPFLRAVVAGDRRGAPAPGS